MNLGLYLQAAVSGVLVGGLFGLMAVGLSLTWGMLRIINLAHFAMILLSGYLTYEIATSFRVDPLLTVAVTAPLMFLIGAALQWGFQVRRVSEFNSLLVTFGLFIVTIQLITNQWSADFRRLPPDLNPYATQAVNLGPLVFPTTTLIAFAVAVVVVGAGHLALVRTYPGRALRAFAQDRGIAAAFGIDHQRLAMILSGAAGATAAVAGMLYAVESTLTPSVAFEWIGIVFAVVIIGGVGNILGTLLAGGLVMMVASVVSVIWSPSFAPFVVFSAIVAALLFRPHGLFSRKRV
ncbi:MAG TPA: branched-chain amino acid ABC transporter permease [Candidatus Limnocylindria bacterium]|nr:branched-chain amino acid ABC transporter permease [Candidatus Limnocylindria bacterium]